MVSQIAGDRPSQLGRRRLRLDEPPLPGAQDAEDDQPEAERRQRRADEVERHPFSGVASAMRRVSARIADDHQDLADEHQRHDR